MKKKTKFKILDIKASSFGLGFFVYAIEATEMGTIHSFGFRKTQPAAQRLFEKTYHKMRAEGSLD